MSQIHPFVKVKRSENLPINVDLETDFQVNSASSVSDLSVSSLCLLVGTNTRYEGSSLNLKQGTAIDKIKLTGDPTYIDCKIGKATLAIKTEFVKKKG